MAKLTTIALINAAVLRELSLPLEQRAASIPKMAERLDRDRSNLAKSLTVLITEGLVNEDPIQNGLTDLGVEQLAAVDRAEGEGAAAPSGLVALRHDQITPNPDNDRKDWDSEEAVADLSALADDIATNGLLQNLVVRAADGDGLHILTGGERRWRAIGLLRERGDWPDDRLIPARLLDADEAGQRIAALSENLQRRNLNPIEEAHGFRGLIDVGLKTADIAGCVGMTVRHVQMRLQLLEDLSEDEQRRMTLSPTDKDYLSPTAARDIIQAAGARRKKIEKAETDLTPRQRLILAELRLAAKNGYIYERVQVAGEAMAEDDDAVALDKGGYLRLPTHIDAEGQTHAYCDQKVWELGELLWPRPEGPAPYAERMREELGLTPPAEGLFSIDWLNPPFDLSAEAQARVDADKARRAEEEEKRQAALKAREAEKQAADEARQRILDAARAARFLLANEPGSREPLTAFTGIAQDAGHPLPWTPGDDGRLIDADGRQVITVTDYWGRATPEGLTALNLLAAAVNAAVGLATPEEPPLPLKERPLDRDAYEAVITLALDGMDEETRARFADATATQVVDSFLAHTGLPYGDDSRHWHALAAEAMLIDYPFTPPEADAEGEGDQ